MYMLHFPRPLYITVQSAPGSCNAESNMEKLLEISMSLLRELRHTRNPGRLGKQNLNMWSQTKT